MVNPSKHGLTMVLHQTTALEHDLTMVYHLNNIVLPLQTPDSKVSQHDYITVLLQYMPKYNCIATVNASKHGLSMLSHS